MNQIQRNDVWRLIVQKSGEPRVRASNGAIWMGRAGRGLFALTITIAIYHIATAEDKVRATANEGGAIGGSMAGAATLGAAGLACGPAAIACVPIGVFVGGVLGAIGADLAFDKIWDSHAYLQICAFYCPNTLVKTMHFSARLLVYSHS